MHFLDDGVEVEAEVQSSPVDHIEEISERVGYAYEVAGFHGRSQFAGFFLDELAPTDRTGHGNGWPCTDGSTNVLVKLANEPGG